MRIEDLTPKQRTCAELAAQGIPNSEIAEVMGIKVRTVKATLGRVFARLGIQHGHKRTRLAALLTAGHSADRPIAPFWIERRAHAIASLAAKGLKNYEVATALGTTEYVVKNYMCSLYDLSGMSNRTEFCGWWQANHNAARVCD